MGFLYIARPQTPTKVSHMSNTVAKYATTTLQEHTEMRPPATLSDHIFIEENICFTVFLAWGVKHIVNLHCVGISISQSFRCLKGNRHNNKYLTLPRA